MAPNSVQTPDPQRAESVTLEYLLSCPNTAFELKKKGKKKHQLVFKKQIPDRSESAAKVSSRVISQTPIFTLISDMIKPSAPKDRDKKENESLHLLQIVPRHYNECKVHIEIWRQLK